MCKGDTIMENRINRRSFLAAGSLGIASAALGMAKPEHSASKEMINTSGTGGQRPNMLIVTADDMGGETPGCYGNTTPDITPNIDAFAREGMVFKNGYITVSVCQPSRNVWMTGRFPHRNGAVGFNPILPGVPTLPEQLKNAGYYTGLIGKVPHYNPVKPEQWDYTSNDLGAHQRNPEKHQEELDKFLQQAEKSGKPWFVHLNISDPHRPFHGSKLEERNYKAKPPLPSRVYSPDEVDVPGYLPDNPIVRRELSWYYSSVKRCDDTFALILETAKKYKPGNTLTMFMSDNGAALPFAKGSVYNSSCRIPWVVTWPGQVMRGTTDDAHFINGTDLMPTLLEVAGAQKPDYMDGASFLPVLKGQPQPWRDHVITVFHRDQYRVLETRAIHTKKWGYIFNAWADGKTRFIADNMEYILYDQAKEEPEIAARLDFYSHRAPEELYNYEQDPWAWNNLADDPQYKQKLEELRGRLIAWMREKGDPNLPSIILQSQDALFTQ